MFNVYSLWPKTSLEKRDRIDKSSCVLPFMHKRSGVVEGDDINKNQTSGILLVIDVSQYAITLKMHKSLHPHLSSPRNKKIIMEFLYL